MIGDAFTWMWCHSNVNRTVPHKVHNTKHEELKAIIGIHMSPLFEKLMAIIDILLVCFPWEQMALGYHLDVTTTWMQMNDCHPHYFNSEMTTNVYNKFLMPDVFTVKQLIQLQYLKNVWWQVRNYILITSLVLKNMPYSIGEYLLLIFKLANKPD